VAVNNLSFWSICAALSSVGCSDRLTVVEAERLVQNAGVFDPILCETPLRIRDGAPTYWRAEKASRSLASAECIQFARREKLIGTGMVTTGDPDITPSCLDTTILLVKPLPGRSAIVHEHLMFNCGSSRAQIIDITYEGHVASIYFREFREVNFDTLRALDACFPFAPEETYHDHVVDAYYARDKWHLGGVWP